MIRPRSLPDYPFQNPTQPVGPWLTSQGFGPGQTWWFTLPSNFNPARLRVGDVFDTPLCGVALRTKVFKADPLYVTYFEGRAEKDNLEGDFRQGDPARLLIALDDNEDQGGFTYHGFVQFGRLTHPTVAHLS